MFAVGSERSGRRHPAQTTCRAAIQKYQSQLTPADVKDKPAGLEQMPFDNGPVAFMLTGALA